MRTQVSIEIAAPPWMVFNLARDVARWPELLPHYRKVTVYSRVDGHVDATMHAVRPVWRLGIPVQWRTDQWAADADPNDLQLRFRHTAGATRGMDVTWHIRPTASGSRVTIEHDFIRPLPLLGEQLVPRIIDRLFVRPIAGRTLATFKSLAERGSH